MSSEASDVAIEDAGAPRVLLLLDATGDRRVLASWLSEGHEVVEATGDEALQADFDLCLLDDATYARLWPQIGERKRRAEPIFLPLVLITSGPTGHLVAEVPKHDVDEVLEAPVQRHHLRERVDVLIGRRRHELRLDAERQAALEGLYESTQRFEILSEANSLLLATNEPEHTIQAIGDKVMRHLEADVFFNYVLERNAERLRLNACGGVDARVAKMIERLDLGQAICGCVARDGERIISDDVQHNGDPRADLVRRMGIRSYCCHPLKAGDKTVGTLSFGTKSKDAFDPDEVELMRTVASQVSIALERSRAENELTFQSFLLESVSDSVIVYYPDEPDAGKLVYVNEAARTERGYTRDEMLRLNVADLIAPEWRHTLSPRLDKLAAGQEVRDESSHLRKDGSTFPVEVWLRRVSFGDRPLVVNVSRDLTDRKRHEERLKESLGKTTRLLEAADALASSASLDDVLGSLTSMVIHMTGHSRVSVALYEEEGKRLITAASKGLEPIQPGSLFELPSDSTSVESASRQVHYDELTTDSDRDARAAAQLALQVPLVYREKLLGLLAVDDPGERREFSGPEVRLIEGIASQASVAIENARLYETQTRQRDYAQALNRINEAIHSTLVRDEILESVVVAVRDALGADSAGLQMLHDEAWETTLISGALPNPVEPVKQLAPSPELLEALRRRTPILSSDASNDPRQYVRIIGSLGVNAVIAVPLVVRDELLGLLFAAWTHSTPRLDDDDVDFGMKAAAALSLSLESVQLLEAEHERARFGQSMAEITQRLASSLDIDETLQDVLEKLSTELAAWGVTASDRVSGGWQIREVAGLEGSGLSGGMTFHDEDSPSAGHVMHSGKPLVVEDVTAETISSATIADRTGYRAFAMYPLVVRGRVTGVLTAFFRQPRKLSAAERDYLGRAAFSISVTEENSRLYKAEHDIADRLQSALLALPDEVRGIQFAHAYHSATEAARVGGDFYDVFELNHDHVGIVVGDVAGKGIDAAVLTSLVKNTIRAHANEQGKTPKRILELTNSVVFRGTSTDAFVTIFFGILDCRDGRLVYGNAGHTTAALLRPNGHVGKLSVTGPLLGAFEDAEYDQAEAVLDLGGHLFLYTDGLTEARSNGDMYGEDRAFDFLATLQRGAPRDIVHAVIEDVLAFSGGRLRDDLAILVVQRIEPGTETPLQQKLEV